MDTGSKHKRLRTGLVAVLASIAVVAPALVAGALGSSAAAHVLILPVVTGLVASMMIGVRVGAIAVLALGAASGLAGLVAGDPALSAVVMALTALGAGLTCRWGYSANLMLLPITIGFLLTAPPTVAGDRLANAGALAGLTVAAGLWGSMVGWLMGRGMTRAPGHLERWDRTAIYAITLAVLTAFAVFISVWRGIGHAGGWCVLTLAIVLQPYLQDSWHKTIQRAGGTIVGVIAAYVIYLIVPWELGLYLIGFAGMAASVVIMSKRHLPYWLFAAVLTAAIVLLDGASTSVESTDVARLLATLAGAGLALAAEAILAPAYISVARKHDLDHY